jgi:hypothetical protein
MSLIGLLILLSAIGLITWLLVTFIPMETTIRRIIIIVAVVLVVLVVLQAMGIFDSLQTVRVPQVE